MVLGKPKKKGGLDPVSESGDGRRRKPKKSEIPAKWAHINPEELKAYKALFKEIDTDGSGGIDRQELRKAMRKRVMRLSEDRIDEVFAEVDKDGDGELDLDEFIEGMLNFKPNEEESGKTIMKSGMVWFRREGLRARLSEEQLKFYKDAFGTMDEQNKGAVNATQFFDLIRFIGVETNLKTVRKLVKDADAVFDHLVSGHVSGVKKGCKVVCWGRSIGALSATHLAA